MPVMDENSYFCLYELGQHVFRVEGDRNLMLIAHQVLNKYQVPVRDRVDATFRLSRSVMHEMRGLDTGWFPVEATQGRCVTYYSRGVPLFSIQYGGDAGTIELRVAINKETSVVNGLLYAILIELAPSSLGLHGVTVICGSRTIILSAPSGTGKTTLARLLNKYCDTAVINGDFALLTIEKTGQVFFEPTPFCGTSQICHKYRLKVDEIVFLEQAPENEWNVLGCRQALARTLSNIFIPVWDSELQQNVANNAFELIGATPMSLYRFAPNKEAADMLHSIVTR